MTLKKYDSYKDSGIEWIGEIPNERKTSRGKFIGQHKKVISRGKVNNLLSLTMKGVLNKDYHGSSGLRPETYNTYQIFNKDDLVFKLIDLENFKTSRVGIVHEQGIMSPVYIRLELNKVSVAKYYYYYYYHLYITKVFNDLGTGVRSSLNAQDLLEIAAPVPSKLNQQAIAAYLDEKTETINKLIRKKKQQINLLEEKRTALINQAVTRGLDPDVELVDSGIEWIGKIPKGWGKIKLKYLFRYEKGSNAATYTKDYIGLNEGEYPVYSGQTKDNGVMGKINTYDYDLERALFVTTVGAKAMSLKLIQGRFSLSQNCAILINKKELSNDYYYYLLQSHFEYEKGLISLIMQPSLRFEDLDKYIIINPPLKVQQAIALYLDEKICKITDLIIKIQSSIDLLTEYKQSLISHVVTGKVKVF